MERESQITAGGDTKDENMFLFRNMGSFETIFMNDTNEAMSHSAQPARSLPNILRSSNARTCKNYKTLMLNRNDISFISVAEDANESGDSDVLSNVSSEKYGKYNTVASLKSHHQRKQVLHPSSDMQYDASHWNDNNNNSRKSEDMLRAVDELKVLYQISLDHEDDTPTKISSEKNSEVRNYLFEKSRQAATRKSGHKYTKPPELSGFDAGATVAVDVNTTSGEVVVQSGTNNHFLGDNGFADIVDAETKSGELSDVLYRDNDIRDLEKEKRSTNCNDNVISGKSTERRNFAMQQDAMRQDLLSYGFLEKEDGLDEEPTDKRAGSNFSFASKVLRTCTCANCTSACDKDFILYEDSPPSCVSSDMETELFTPCVYDFYPSDYYHMFADMDGFDNKIFCHDEAEEKMSVTKENACNDNNIDNCGAATLIENNNNVSTDETLKQLRAPCTEEIQDVHVESYPTKHVAHFDESTESSKVTGRAQNLDQTDYFNFEDVSMEGSEATSQNKVTVSTNVSVLASQNQPRKSKKGKSERKS